LIPQWAAWRRHVREIVGDVVRCRERGTVLLVEGRTTGGSVTGL
jgi:hypothetical protein